MGPVTWWWSRISPQRSRTLNPHKDSSSVSSDESSKSGIMLSVRGPCCWPSGCSLRGKLQNVERWFMHVYCIVEAEHPAHKVWPFQRVQCMMIRARKVPRSLACPSQVVGNRSCPKIQVEEPGAESGAERKSHHVDHLAVSCGHPRILLLVQSYSHTAYYLFIYYYLFF